MATARPRQPIARPVRRRRQSGLITLALLIVIALAAGLVALLLWVETRDEPEPMIGPGTFNDASGAFRFEVPDGWEVIYESPVTRLIPPNESLPAFTLDARSIDQIALVVNWNCRVLPDFAARATRAIAPWEFTQRYSYVPCATDERVGAYIQSFVTLNDGRSAVIVFGPLDGVNWVVAMSMPFEGQASAALVDTMTAAVLSARRF
jgi:hypothetical protein